MSFFERIFGNNFRGVCGPCNLWDYIVNRRFFIDCRLAAAHAASLTLARQPPVSLSPLSLFTVSARVGASPDHPMSPAPLCTVIRIWLKNLIFKMSYTLFYNNLYCKSQTHLTWILGVHVYNSSNAFNVNEFSQKRNVRKRN